MRKVFYAMVGVGLLVASSGFAIAGPAEQAVVSSLQAQMQWLGKGPVAEGWADFLLTDELSNQLARGSAADRRVVSEILSRYQSQTPGVERRQFAAVRQALEAWLAALPEFSAEELPRITEEAKKQFVPPPPQKIDAAKAKLQQAVGRLQSFLASGGQERQAGWASYLELETLQAELAKPASPDLRKLQSIESLFFQNEVGLERTEFRQVRSALRAYNNYLLAISDKDPQAAYEAQLDQLAKLLDAYAKEGRDADAIEIGNTLNYLASTQQAEPLVRAVRQQYSLPNLYVTASQRLAGAGVNRVVNEVSPVRENILGTDIHGTAHTTGQVYLRTVPSASNAVLELVMNGHARSNNIGYNGPVTVCTIGNTSLSASKRVFFSPDGLVAQPVVAVASTDTTITSLSAKLKIIERIGERRAAEQQPQSEAIASQRAERRLQKRFESQSAPELARANREYHNRFRTPLIRRGAFPQILDFTTTADSIRITGLHAERSRIGAPTPAPRLDSRHDLAVRVHESMVGNAGETGIGGRKLTDERLAEIMKEATGEVPEELQITEDKDPWSITFSAVRPISVAFDAQTVTIGIRGTQFTRGERVIRKDMIISAKYKLEQQGNGSRLTREGDVVADYVGNRGSISAADVAFKTFIRRKFSALFKEEIENDGLKLPGRWSAAGKLTLRRMESDNGWLTLAWDQPEPMQRPVSVVGAE